MKNYYQRGRRRTRGAVEDTEEQDRVWWRAAAFNILLARVNLDEWG
jgi:hypothetical protein